jgi:1-acyl-sn-glycerol-3-phosphate acyltransferase
VNAIRSFVYFVWMIGGTLVMAVICIPTLLSRRASMAALKTWARYLRLGLRLICGVRIEVRGTPPTGPALIGAKHQGMLDIVGPLTFLPDACYIMKKELMYIPIFGWWAASCKMVWIDRSAHSAALKKMLNDVRERMGEARQVVIFPEGTRVAPGKTGEYKPGVAALYRDLDLPVIPCATNSGLHWPAKGWMRYPGTVVFEYLEPIPAGLKRGEFMRLLQERIEPATRALLDEDL